MLCKEIPQVSKSEQKVSHLLERLCIIGTIGDLGSIFQFENLLPKKDMDACFKRFGKKTLHDVVGLINARMSR